MLSRNISPSARAFLAELVDYAGLFPPARLDLASALQNFVRYRGSDDHWMLGTFVCPASRLSELLPHAEALREQSAHPFSVLGPGAGNREEWELGLASVRSAIDFVIQHLDGIVFTRAVELKLPLSVATSGTERKKAALALQTTFAPVEAAFDIFVEIVPSGNAETVAQVARVLLDLEAFGGRNRTAMKIRTGGVTADTIPEASDVAHFVCACRDVDIRFKATAGLHHALHHYSNDVGSVMHGFLNVFAGAIIAAEHELTPDALTDLLLMTEETSFQFDDTGLTVGELFVTTSRIDDLRHNFAVSFGSCSFDEPREDLEALGII